MQKASTKALFDYWNALRGSRSARDRRDIDPTKTQVIVEWSNGTNSLLIPDGIGECGDGWKYNTVDQTIVLCDSTCDEVRLDADEKIHVSFGCDRDVIDDIVE